MHETKKLGKLKLSTETLRRLEPNQARKVGGGTDYTNARTDCATWTYCEPYSCWDSCVSCPASYCCEPTMDPGGCNYTQTCWADYTCPPMCPQ